MSDCLTYQEMLKKLYSINVFNGMLLGLKNCHELNTALVFPDKNFSSIHVAGTNGKGSVTHKIAMGLQAQGYRVGQYTSPHISSFRERIRINQELISEQNVLNILNEIFRTIEVLNLNPTLFEITTFLALCYFDQEKVDFAVLETGLGGRLDATNIISPRLSIITSISIDHAEILGDTIEKIAYEKAGIIKPGIPIITGPRVPEQVISKVAHESNSQHFHLSKTHSNFEDENCSIAKKALELFDVDDVNITKGLNSHLPCRLQIVEKDDLPIFCNKPFPKKVVLDVGHNPDGLEKLFSAIKEKEHNPRIRILCGLSKTKDIDGCLKILKQNCEDFHLVEPKNGRGTNPKILADKLLNLGVDEAHIFLKSGIEDNLKDALEQASINNQILVVCGTFFIMGDVRKTLGFNDPHDELDMN